MTKRLVALVSSLILVVLGFGSAVDAAPNPGSIALYFSAPFVTGSHVTDSAYTETYNSYATTGQTVNCPSSIPFATVSFSGTNCGIGGNAGTSPGSSEPAIGVPYSGFVTNTNGVTYTFNSPVKYVGFWWMMGSAGNTVNFYDAANTLISMNVNDVITAIGVTEAQAGTLNFLANDTGTLTTIDGSTHLRKRYYRGPAAYTGTVQSPVFNYDDSSYANQPWVYLNLFVSGDYSVSKVVFSGSDFEMDNLTVSTVESGPTNSMVMAKVIAGTPPTGQAMTWAPTNTTFGGPENQLTPNNLAVVTNPVSGGGPITYSVINAGASGCTVNATTGVITYTAAGTCLVRATSAATANYYSAYKEATFTFQATPSVTVTSPPISSSPSATTTALATTGGSIFSKSASAVLMVISGSFVLAFVARKRFAR
jgi:hypothetical protein